MTDKQGQPYQSLCYCTNLRRSANMITELYDIALKESGLTVAQYYLLINLSRLRAANITHWAAHVGLDRSTMVRNIKVLQERNFVSHTQGHGKMFTLSPEGESALKQAIPLWQATQERIEQILGQEDAETILRINAKLQNLSTL